MVVGGAVPDKMAAIHISGMSRGASGTSEGFSRFPRPLLKRMAAHYRWAVIDSVLRRRRRRVPGMLTSLLPLGWAGLGAGRCY